MQPTKAPCFEPVKGQIYKDQEEKKKRCEALLALIDREIDNSSFQEEKEKSALAKTGILKLIDLCKNRGVVEGSLKIGGLKKEGFLRYEENCLEGIESALLAKSGFEQKSTLRRLITEVELDKKSGECWECIRGESISEGGVLYTFRVLPQYNYLLDGKISKEKYINYFIKREAQFPAVEEGVGDFVFLRRDLDESQKKTLIHHLAFFENLENFNLPLQISKIKRAPIFQRLGYVSWVDEQGGFCLQMPDREALQNLLRKYNREEQKEGRVGLGPLSIASSKGIATDLKYFLGNFQHDLLISSGKEFVHDQQAHVIATLHLLIS